VWFGVLLAVNMQTSFMHPPFGFALFYLRSVAPNDDYTDKITNKPVAKVTTGQIYWGAVPFVIIQLIMVGLIIAFPGLVSSGLVKEETIDADKAFQELRMQDTPAEAPASAASDPLAADPGASAPEEEPTSDDDPMKALEDAMKADEKKSK